MKKRVLALLVMIALVLTSVIALVACNPEPEEETPSTKKYTVRFYEGTTVIKQVEIEEGKTIDATYKPDKEGMTFIAWYDDSSLAGDPYDVTTPVKSDLQLFGKWQSNTVEADTRIWYVMGNVNKGWDCATAMNEDGKWEIVEGMEDSVLTKAEGKNEFSITLEMRAGGGSKFRFVTQLEDKATWAGAERAQSGLGHIEGFAKATGINPVDKTEYTLGSDMEWYGNVKKDDKVIFEGGREYDDPTYMWNIYVTAESEGIYKFTLHTFPGEDADRNYITWEKTGDVAVLEKTHDMYIVGSYKAGTNDWKDEYREEVLLEQNADSTNLWTAILNVTEADYATWAESGTKAAIKVRNNVDGEYYSIGNDNILLSAGDYYLVYNSEDDSVKVEELGYYIVGTMIDGEENVNFSIKAGYSPKLTISEGVAAANITITDVTASYSWLTEKTLKGTETPAGAIYAIKVVYGTSISVLNWYGASGAADIVGDGNYYFTAAGDYTVSFDIETKTMTVTEAAPVDNSVAKIGETGYETLEAAIAAAQANDTIVLQKDVKIETTLVITKKITLDLNGKTISSDNRIWGTAQTADLNNWSMISVQANGDLTITGNGRVIAKQGDLTQEGASCYAIDVRAAGAKLTIENGEYVGNRHCIYVREGSAILNGGKYSIYASSTNETMGYKYVLNLKDGAEATISVTGGQYVNYNPAQSASENPVTSFVAEGYAATSATEGELTIWTVAPVEAD